MVQGDCHLQESAVTHYKGFIEVASCLKSLRQEVASMSNHLAELQDDFPALNDACDSFTKEAKQQLAKRAENKSLQSKHRRSPPNRTHNISCPVHRLCWRLSC